MIDMRDSDVQVGESMFRHMAEAMPQIVWIAGPDGSVEYFNTRWYEFTGLTAEKCLGRDWGWKSVIHPEDVARSVEVWTRAVTSGNLYEIEYRLKGAREEYRWFLGRALPVRDEHGTIIRWFGTCTDIDSQKRSEEEKTRALAREQAAIEASRLKSEFLANMSHEIRTPINGVIGMTSLLGHTMLTPEQREYTDAIMRSADALLTVLNDILDLSKVEAGKLDLQIVEFSLQRLIQDLEKTMGFAAQSKGIRLRSEVPPGLASFYLGDPGRIRQILNNLLSNALKFTEQGQITLRVHREPQARNQDRLRFEVEDTGIGIGESLIPSLFKPFSQADASASRRYGGTGLGLSICRRLVELMGGEIGVLSSEGRGSTFWFELRLNHGKQPESSEQAGMSGNAQVGTKGRLASILIAEDNLVSQMVTARMVEKLGYQVDVVANGEEVIAALNQREYDLVLMDCQMPIMDGYETSRRIRASEREELRRLPIVALTAHAIKGDREKCLSAGMSDYLTKPLKLEDLARMLDRWFGQGGRSQAESEAVAPAPESRQEGEGLLDLRILSSLRKLEDEAKEPLVRRLVEVFSARTPARLSRIEAAYEASDPEALSREAHALKGAALNIGAKRLGAVCLELEEGAKKGFDPKLLELVQKVRAEYDAAIPLLEIEAGRVGSPVS